MANLWSRLRERITGWFRREPTPGRFESGSKFSLQGIVGTVPFVWPSRDYLVYVPKGRSRWKRAPLIVLCHGCKQTPEEIAQGTRIAQLADRLGCVVLLPRQKESANPWRCWNWFERRTMDGQGEAAIVAAQIRSVRRKYRVDRRRVLVAGMSAGGALAAILGVRYPLLVTAVAVHSGIACGAAASPLAALPVMQRGPAEDVEGIAQAARTQSTARDLVIPLLAMHGDDDPVVAPVNAVALVRQYLRLNGHPAVAGPANALSLPTPDVRRDVALADGRVETIREWRSPGRPDGPHDGRLLVRHVAVAGLAHAWSGGDAALPYNDAAPPDATALVGDFFADALS